MFSTGVRGQFLMSLTIMGMVEKFGEFFFHFFHVDTSVSRSGKT